MKKVEAIIQSMIPHERRNPQIINGSRKRRIAKEQRHDGADINRLLKQFDQSRKLIKQLPAWEKRRGN